MSEQLIPLVESMITRAASVSDLERLVQALSICHAKAEKALHNVTVGYEPEPAALLPAEPEVEAEQMVETHASGAVPHARAKRVPR